MMMILETGRSTTVQVSLGGSLEFLSSTGSGVLIRIPNPVGNGEPFVIASLNGSPAKFGPFEDTALFRLICDSGVISYQINAGNSSLTRQFTKTVNRRSISSINVAPFSDLSVAASEGSSGYLFPRLPDGSIGEVTYFTGASLVINNPGKSAVIYSIVCLSGEMVVSSGYFPNSSVTPVISGAFSRAKIGQTDYQSQLSVVPNGTPVTFSPEFVSDMQAHGFVHDGFGRVTSSGVI